MKDAKDRAAKEERRRKKAAKKAEKLARAQAEIDRIKNEGKTEDQIEKERQERKRKGEESKTGPCACPGAPRTAFPGNL